MVTERIAKHGVHPGQSRKPLVGGGLSGGPPLGRSDDLPDSDDRGMIFRKASLISYQQVVLYHVVDDGQRLRRAFVEGVSIEG